MGPFKGLDVRVISNTKSLKLYNGPDDVPTNDPRVRQHYIEAVTGATFVVKVTLDKSLGVYSLGPDDAVRVRINYDGQPTSWFYDFAVPQLLRTWSQEKLAEHTFHSISLFDRATQQWKQGATTFCALKTSELLYMQ